jgi:hypothetical protein
MSYTSLTQKITINASYGKWVQIKRVVPKFVWRNGHPAGYTDDLGIIADRNQWVEEVTPGWYSDIDPQEYMAIREWCEQNLKHGDWCTGVYYVILQREEDVAWFMLRWS